MFGLLEGDSMLEGFVAVAFRSRSGNRLVLKVKRFGFDGLGLS